jgi:RNase P/RNase MRP subunit p29
MAAKKKPVADPNQLPEFLATTLLEAKGRQLPGEALQVDQAIPKLWELLSPREITLEGTLGQKVPRRAIRQPLLSIYWSAGIGGWVVAVTDRVLKFKVTAVVLTLANALAEFEEALAAGKTEVKALE